MSLNFGGLRRLGTNVIFEFVQLVGEIGARHLSNKEDLRSPIEGESATFSIRGQLRKTRFFPATWCGTENVNSVRALLVAPYHLRVCTAQ